MLASISVNFHKPPAFLTVGVFSYSKKDLFVWAISVEGVSPMAGTSKSGLRGYLRQVSVEQTTKAKCTRKARGITPMERSKADFG